MLTKYVLLGLGLSLSFYPIAGANTTTPLAAEMAKLDILSEVSEVKEVWVTAYSSTPEETDDTPFITASGKTVRDGVVATNLLPFGTEVKIPEVFGDKVFVVEDRMHQRKTNHLDVWMPTKTQANNFGITYTQILVLK